MAETEIKKARAALRQLRAVVDEKMGRKTPIPKSRFVPSQCPYCCSTDIVFHGFYKCNKMRVQRFLCAVCRRTFRKSAKPCIYRGINIGMHYRIDLDTCKFAVDLLIPGASRREITRKTGLQAATVHRLSGEIRAAGLMPTFCSCGKPHGHKGWCKDRFNRSKRRQAALAKLHERQRR